MTDPWARPDPDLAPVERPVSFEITLEGAGVTSRGPRPADGGSPAARPNWRKIAALSALTGIALGLVAAVVVLRSGDDSESSTPPVTSAPLVDPSQLTTPPTLPPVRTDPPPAVTEPLRPVVTVPPVTEPTVPLTLPVFEIDAAPPDGTYDLVRAVASLASGATGGVVSSATLVDENQRADVEVADNADGLLDSMTVSIGDASGVESFGEIDYVFDNAAGRGFVHGVSGDEVWELVTEPEFFTGGFEDLQSVEDVVSAIAAPMLTPDVLELASFVEPAEIVLIDGQPARRYRLSIGSSDTGMSIVSLLLPAGGVGRSVRFDVEAFVSPDDRLVLTTARSVSRGADAVIVMRHTLLTGPIPVELPPLELIVDEQLFS